MLLYMAPEFLWVLPFYFLQLVDYVFVKFGESWMGFNVRLSRFVRRSPRRLKLEKLYSRVTAL